MKMSEAELCCGQTICLPRWTAAQSAADFFFRACEK